MRVESYGRRGRRAGFGLIARWASRASRWTKNQFFGTNGYSGRCPARVTLAAKAAMLINEIFRRVKSIYPISSINIKFTDVNWLLKIKYSTKYEITGVTAQILRMIFVNLNGAFTGNFS
jgi:hypothetical protein